MIKVTNWDKYDNQFYNQPDNTVLLEENRWLEGIIRSLNIQDQHCLDYGCGGSTHWIPFYLAQGVTTITGVDISQEAVERCREMYPYPTCQFFQLQTKPISLATGSIDLVTATWVIQYVYSQNALEFTLAEIKRVLKLAGRFLVVSNLYPDPGSRVFISDTGAGHLFQDEGQDQGNTSIIRLFPENSMISILEPLGFRRTYQSTMGWSFCELYSLEEVN